MSSCYVAYTEPIRGFGTVGDSTAHFRTVRLPGWAGKRGIAWTNGGTDEFWRDGYHDGYQ
ncbi:hypothetical protein [Candidatus Symbiobacter mobilis]|uniref:hypothetical protein n=1 Tax=Candidatus Symbiobacter mobilis TaxID=1436290 RepID=UPI001EE66C64|nr:hypothetical protein [Candidatus Symbiobacter mobilis]